MASLVVRGFLSTAKTIELLDPLPEGFESATEVQVLLTTDPQTTLINGEFDTVTGIESPNQPISLSDFAEEMGGIWANRHDEIPNSVEWIKAQRQQEIESDDPWRGQTFS